MENKCLVEPVPTNFIHCTAAVTASDAFDDHTLPIPICANEFNAVVSHMDDGDHKVAKCFLDLGFEDTHTTPTGSALHPFSIDEMESEQNRNIASCLTRKLLPAGDILGPRAVLRGFGDLWQIVMFIKDNIEKGINIPGDAICKFFFVFIFT